MVKKRFILLSVLVVFLITILTFQYDLFRSNQNDLVQFLNRLLVGDKMIVKTRNNLEIKKVRINISNTDKIVFENNRFYNNIGNIYGGPMFDIYYDNTLLGKAFHWNTNDWYRNKFMFDVYQEQNQIKFKFKTIGKNKNGEQGYITIKDGLDSLYFESFDYDGNLINSWKEKKE